MSMLKQLANATVVRIPLLSVIQASWGTSCVSSHLCQCIALSRDQCSPY